MARPTLTHDGFILPNASVAATPRMAEPDQVDFNTLAHARWGVLDGCLVTVSGSTASTLGGTALVNGVLVTVSAQSVEVGVGGAQDRIDLVVVDQGGTLKRIAGTPSADPVHPDPPITVTTLASVLVPTGVSSLADYVLDKRKFLSTQLLTKIDAALPLLQNVNASGNHFLVTGGGTMTWENDTVLQRSVAKTVRVTEKLIVDDTVAAGGAVTGASFTATGQILGSNLGIGAALPGSAANGSIFVLVVGSLARLYVRTNGAWAEIATVAGAVPVGSVIQSVEPPSVMVPQGWVPLNGSTISESAYPSLFGLTSLSSYISGTAPNRTMVLPNAQDRVFMTRWGQTALGTGGAIDNMISLVTANMPKHKHSVNVAQYAGGTVGITIAQNGEHNHVVSGGSHSHVAVVQPHKHRGFESDTWATGFANVIATAWGGRNKLDALFNDRNHTYSVEPMEWTSPADVDVTVSTTGSTHGHTVAENGQHTHSATGTFPLHDHAVTEQEVGSGAAFGITPAYISTYAYIRS